MDFQGSKKVSFVVCLQWNNNSNNNKEGEKDGRRVGDTLFGLNIKSFLQCCLVTLLFCLWP